MRCQSDLVSPLPSRARTRQRSIGHHRAPDQHRDAGEGTAESVAGVTRATAVRRAALVVAVVHLALGLLGTLPPAHLQWHEVPDALLVRNGSGLLLGVMPNNLVVTAVRLGIGVCGVAASRGLASSVAFLKLVTVGSALLAGLSLLPAGEAAFGAAPIAGANRWFHIAVAAAAAVAGWGTGARRVVGVASARDLAPSVETARRAHQLLAPFPLVCLLGAALTDIALWWTTRSWYNGSGPFWDRASLWLIGTGLTTGVLCALAGVVLRWREESHQRSGGLIFHNLAATVGLAVAAVNAAARATSPDLVSVVAGTGLSVTAAAAVAFSYWVGLVADRGDGSRYR
jgi:uncharacterized membrane protein